MQLFVVRHAKAAERNSQTIPDDSLRPLTASGAKKFSRLAKRVSKLFDAPQLVLASGYVRAWETARLLESAAGWPAPTRCADLECDASDSVNAITAALAERTESSVAIVGHEPFLSEFVAHLISADPASIVMEKGAVAVLEVDGPLRGASLFALISPSWIASKKSKR